MARTTRNVVTLAMLPLAVPLQALESRSDTVTIDGLVAREKICRIAVSPNGAHVAYVSARGLSREDAYAVTLTVLPTAASPKPTTLFDVNVAPNRVFADTESFVQTTAQLAWSPDSRALVYTRPTEAGLQLWWYTLSGGKQELLLDVHKLIELGPPEGEGRFGLRVSDEMREDSVARPAPSDLALRVLDGFRFRSALDNPHTKPKLLIRRATWDWTKRELVFKAGETKLVPQSGEAEWRRVSPALGSVRLSASESVYRRNGLASRGGRYVAAVEETHGGLSDVARVSSASQVIIVEAGDREGGTKIETGRGRDRTVKNLLGWSADDRWLYYVDVGARETTVNAIGMPGGIVREIVRTAAELDPSPIIGEQPANLDARGRIAVMVRSTNVTPDELVAVDLETGRVTTLAEPNRELAGRRLPAVRFYEVESTPGGGPQYGRLYLPIDYREGQRYPLVLTNYVSRPGFDASVGDELPILPLTANGIAVFSLHSRESNSVSSQGDFRFEINRIKRPVAAMEWLIGKLTEEGIVDADRIGLQGVSYGAEIALYGLWTSKAFRAVSVASGSWEPTRYYHLGLAYAKYLGERGFPDPETDPEGKWKQLSAALNASSRQPPLLIQGADGETIGTAATWFRLRAAGAPIEWHVYPGEGHVKRNPANRYWVYSRNLDWFRFWLKDEEDPDPAKAEQYARWREMRAKWESTRNAVATGKP